MTTQTHPNDMDRNALKDLIKERGWTDINLKSSTEELREEVASRLGVEAQKADTLPPAPIVATPEAPSVSDLAGPAPAPIPTLERFVKAPVAPVAGPQSYRVERFAKWVKEGVVYQLRAGTFVSTATHPIEELRAQGVPLAEVSEVDDSDPGLGHRFV